MAATAATTTHLAPAAFPLSGLLATAFTEILGAPVVTYEEYQRCKSESPEAAFQSLDVDQLFRLSYHWGSAGGDEDEGERGTEAGQSRVTEGGRAKGLSSAVQSLSLSDIAVRVKTLNGYAHVIRVGEHDSVGRLKEKIREKLEMPCEEQRLTFQGRELDDDHTSISDYGVKQDSILVLMMLSRSSAGRPIVPTSVLEDDTLFDHTFDFDFTNIDDGKTKFYRGGKRYYRPCGWQRFALKVKGRYVNNEDGKNDEWLGAPGHRLDSAKGEWPVSYHGTPKKNADSITRKGFLLSMRKRALFGPGIYSTPSIEVAADKGLYAEPFTFSGKEYQLVFQNRVCPRGMKVIPEERTYVGAEYWIQDNENLVRPYGICVRPCQ